MNIGNQAIVRASKNALAAKTADEHASAKARSVTYASQSRSQASLVFSRRSPLAERLVVETPAEGGGMAICCLSSLWCAHSAGAISIESIEDGSWMHSVLPAHFAPFSMPTRSNVVPSMTHPHYDSNQGLGASCMTRRA